MKTLCWKCKAEAVPTTLMCMEHIEAGNLDCYAAEYAVASILYYEHDTQFFSDARYDGLCWHLKQEKAWRTIPWLEESMLSAGSGFDTSRLPAELRELAKEILECSDTQR